MDREFLELFNQELAFFNDHIEEFAREYPGIADRLGGLARDNQDPMIAGLLEGAAFLAARVQLKLKHEFLEFTSNYIEQLLPNYLAPTPSALLAQFRPPYGDPALREGMAIGSGEIIEATYLERERRIACRYQLRAPVTLWPFQLTDANYLASPAALQALDVPLRAPAVCGVRLRFTHRIAAMDREEPADADVPDQPSHWVSGCRTDALTVHLCGPEADAVALYEQLFANLSGIFIRFRDRHGDPVVLPLPVDAIRPVGLGDDDMLIPEDRRVFRGFHLLQDYFLFPHKFLGFTLTRLRPVLAKVKAKSFDILFAFSAGHLRLPAIVTPAMFTLYAAPAINLFERTMDRVSVQDGRHEYHVIPDRTRPFDFEPHRITEVWAHLSGGHEKVEVLPLYSGPGRQTASGEGLFYSVRRLPRRRSSQEERFGPASNYAGTELFISVTEPPGMGLASRISQLSIKGLCSNRHLTEQLPVGGGGVDFTLLKNSAIEVFCAAGPTPPRPPVVSYQPSQYDRMHTGTVAWRLVNMLSLNQLGLNDGAVAGGAHNLRELLLLFSDPADPAIRRRVKSIRGLTSRPIVRRIRMDGGFGAARGLDVTVTMEDAAFEGSGAFLLGVVLNTFFAQYVSINRFTQTTLRTVERGVVKCWTPHLGTRVSL